MMTEAVVSLAIIMVAIMPLVYSFFQEQRVLRTSYQKALAMELIDGEMEILLAGEWRAFHEGTQPYVLRGAAVTNLPKGQAQLTIKGQKLRLAWTQANGRTATQVVREGVGR